MAFLLAAVLLVGALGAVNLLFTFGVVRRLREHTQLLDTLFDLAGTGGLAGRQVHLPSVGDRVGDFAAVTVDGEPVTPASLPDPTVVAFLSPGCEGCQEELPALVKWAKGQERTGVLAVVIGRSTSVAELVAALRPIARVVVEEEGATPVLEAFRVGSFPAFCVVGDGGEVRAVTRYVRRLPVTASA